MSTAQASIEQIAEAVPAGRSPLAYPGWRVVAIGFFIFFFGFGAPMTMPMIYPEVMREFGWSLTQATFIYTFKSGVGAIVCFFLLGPLVDRFGLKPVMVCVMLLEALGLASFLMINSLWSYYMAGVLIGLGHGAVLICTKLLVARWFMRNVGFAGAVAIIGSSVGGIVFPIVTSFLIPELGWRGAFACLSLAVVFISIPLAMLANANPTEEEVLPEALPTAKGEDAAEALRQAEVEYSFRDLLRQRMFWYIPGTTLLVSFVDQAFFQHTIVYLTGEAGLSTQLAASALSVTFIAGFIAKLGAGAFFDRYSTKGVAFWNVLLAGVVVLAFGVQGIITAFIFTCARGLVHGGLVVDAPVVIKHVYGPKFMNRLLPLVAGASTLGSAMGPVALAAIHDRTGGYQAGFILFIFMALGGAFLISRVRPLYRDRLRAAAAGELSA